MLNDDSDLGCGMAQQQADDAITVQRLGKAFAGRTVLDQVNFSIKPGKITGLLGPNGAGKTTLLRCLIASIPADYGRCLINGYDPVIAAPQARASFGYQPDLPPLEPELRVQEYLQFHGDIRGLDSAMIPQRIDTVLTQVALTAQAQQLVGTLSRGQKSRLALAEALLHQPPILILDEPASGLDPAQVVSLRNLLKELGGQHTIFMATHHLSEAQAVCDDIVVMVAGRIRYQGTAETLAAGDSLEAAYLSLTGTLSG